MQFIKKFLSDTLRFYKRLTYKSEYRIRGTIIKIKDQYPTRCVLGGGKVTNITFEIKTRWRRKKKLSLFYEDNIIPFEKGGRYIIEYASWGLILDATRI